MILTALPFILAMGGQAVPPPQAAPPPAAAVVQKPAAAPRKLYNETADAKVAITAAVAAAAEDGIRVLVNWGGNDCPRCASIGLAQRDPGFGVKLSDEYKVVYVDVGNADRNGEVAQAFGVKLTADGLPHFTILDAKGAAIAQVAGKDFAAEADPAKLDGKKLGAFLKQHQAPPPPPAQPQLTAALEQAKRQDKQVFLWFTAPW